MDRYWLLTWTTYGNWLPGDARGFVSSLRDEQGLPYLHNVPGTPYDSNLPELQRAMRESMKGDPIRLNAEQASVLLDQFQETATHRAWLLLAVAIMGNHIHLVVGVPGDPEPEKILHSFKSYASRALNQRWRRPVNGTWWTGSGSKRRVKQLLDAVEYVRNQEFPLLIWINEAMRTLAVDQGERGQ